MNFSKWIVGNLKGLCVPLSLESYMISRLMGGIKILKEGFPIRPIIPAPDCIGKDASEWILRKVGINR